MTARQSVSLSERDQAILLDLARVRLLSGKQLVRLHFADLANDRARGSSCRRTMQRLLSHRLVTTLPRRIGGYRAGSAGLVYTLDAAGQRWVATRANNTGTGRIRRPWSIGSLFVGHTLDVTELYVRLRERERDGTLRLLSFDAEPASWHRTAIGLLKPDAYAAWVAGAREQHRWLEVDRGTESLPTLRRKLLAYVDAANGGGLGPHGVFPQVIVSVPTPERQAVIVQLVEALPSPGDQLIEVAQFAELFKAPVVAGSGRPPPA